MKSVYDTKVIIAYNNGAWSEEPFVVDFEFEFVDQEEIENAAIAAAKSWVVLAHRGEVEASHFKCSYYKLRELPKEPEKQPYFSKEPHFCPRCGGKDLKTFVNEADKEAIYPAWGCDLDEHQCHGICEGASFWM